MLNLDPGKLLVIAVVAVILLGPDRLPQLARQVGGAWRSFNEYRHRMESEMRSSMPDLPSSAEIARLARSPSALLDHLSQLSPDSESPGAPESVPADASNGGPERPPTQPAPLRTRPSAVAAQTPRMEPDGAADPGLN
jgi:sec-independent protein translocase protein TatB